MHKEKDAMFKLINFVKTSAFEFEVEVKTDFSKVMIDMKLKEFVEYSKQEIIKRLGSYGGIIRINDKCPALTDFKIIHLESEVSNLTLTIRLRLQGVLACAKKENILDFSDKYLTTTIKRYLFENIFKPFEEIDMSIEEYNVLLACYHPIIPVAGPYSVKRAKNILSRADILEKRENDFKLQNCLGRPKNTTRCRLCDKYNYYTVKRVCNEYSWKSKVVQSTD